MPDEKPKFDPFKPAQPRIPGVSDAPPAPPPESVAPPQPPPRGRFTPQQLAISAAGAVVLAIVLAWLFLRPSAPSAPAEVASVPAAPVAVEPAAVKASSSTVTPEVAPLYPDEVATAEEMDRPWAYKRFNFMKKVTQGPVPALLVRLPGGSARSGASYWAFALKTRYGKCDLELVTDVEKLRNDFGYRAQHPMVVEPCSDTVFDPLQRGTVSGAWVRGEVVQGSASRPPLMIEVQIKGNRVLAVQME